LQRWLNASVDYIAERLAGRLAAGVDYTVNGTVTRSGEDGAIAIDDAWFGTTISLAVAGGGTAPDGTTQRIALSAHPGPLPVL